MKKKRRSRCSECGKLFSKRDMRAHKREHLGRSDPVQKEAANAIPASPAQVLFAEVSGLFFNPRLMAVTDMEGLEHEVLVGNARLFWMGAPVLIRPSVDYGDDYWELVEEAPRFKGDRSYVERIERARAASSAATDRSEAA